LTDQISVSAGEDHHRSRRGVRRAALDRDGTMPGRGAYLCRGGAPDPSILPAPDCLTLALKRGAIARSLRCAVTLPVELVESVSP
jgi:predicted RNA-binding protein YlxR (DUF448 family)